MARQPKHEVCGGFPKGDGRGGRCGVICMVGGEGEGVWHPLCIVTHLLCSLPCQSKLQVQLLCLVTNACLWQSAITVLPFLETRQPKHEVCDGFRKGEEEEGMAL